MPATAILNLRVLKGGKIPRSFHCLMHPLFLDKIATVAPPAVAAIHDSQLMNAFSLSPVMDARSNEIFENQNLWVRIGLLTDEMETLFIDSLEAGLWGQLLKIGDLTLAVESAAVGPQEDNPWCGRESYEALLRRSHPNGSAGLRIESPMAFKRGDLHFPLPDPALIFGNLLKRWNLVAPMELPALKVADKISFSLVDIKTKPFALRNGGTILGSVGRVVFIFKAPPEDIYHYNLLLNFAFYAGIGVKTSQGMGMCRVVEGAKKGIIKKRKPDEGGSHGQTSI